MAIKNIKAIGGVQKKVLRFRGKFDNLDVLISSLISSI